MIVLDTNVVSELMKPLAAASVARWVGTQPASSLYVTSITQAEILYGILLMPAGKRRSTIESAAETTRRRAGRPISQFDAQIAAIARATGAAVATRNVDDFKRCGIKVIDPWTA